MGVILAGLAMLAAGTPTPTRPVGKLTEIYVYNFPTADSCATWTRSRADKHAQQLEGWILGFVTGANAYGRGTGNLAPDTTADGLLGWVDQYCQANPLESVTTAGFKLVGELQRRRKS